MRSSIRGANRREILAGLTSAPWLLAMAGPASARPFDADFVAERARALARRPFQPPSTDLPPRLTGLSYDAYRAIRYRPEAALWRDARLPFQVELFFRGRYSRERVDLFEVQGGRATPIAFDADRFESDKVPLEGLPRDLGYAGFRLHAPINRADYFDEVAVFLGASYFRSLGRGQAYGLSARGLALNTGGPGNEEFPIFRSFWIERPQSGATSVVVHALLDSPSTTGAYRFVIHPADTTVFDVEARLFPRRDLAAVGIAPSTSMFLFGPASARRFNDFRSAVHDSEGLQIFNGAGEHIWRPLTNPVVLQESAFEDRGPRGFGLVQRSRRLSDYQDLEARYDLRPSLWVEPQDDWGAGAVHLIELPEATEYDDNIVAFWRPRDPLAAASEHLFRYRLSWGPPPAGPSGLAQVAQTRVGTGHSAGSSVFAIDFTVLPGAGLDGIEPRIWSSAGQLSPPTLTPSPDGGGLRLSFELTPGTARVAELRAELSRPPAIASESWMFRWTA